MRGARTHHRHRWVALAITLVVAAGILLGLIFVFDRLTREPLTVEQEIRQTVESFIEACRERDYGTVWELQSRNTRRMIRAQRRDARIVIPDIPNDLNDEEFFAAAAKARASFRLPDSPRDWFPWALPPAIVARLEITRIEMKPDGGALVEMRPDGDGRIGVRRCRTELTLEQEEIGWRLGQCSFYLTQDLLAPPPPPLEERGKLEDGRTFLTLGIGEEPARADHDPAQVLILRVDRRTTFGSVTPLLESACRAGVEEIRIRPERRTLATRGIWVMFYGLEATMVTSGAVDPPEIVYPIPDRLSIVELVIGVGRRARPGWSDGERRGALPFRTSISAESSRALARFTNLLEKPLEDLDVIVSVHPTTDIGRLANVWSDLADRGCKGPILATENPLGAGYASALLLNGLRPDQIMRTNLDTLPRVWPDNPVLQRTIARSK